MDSPSPRSAHKCFNEDDESNDTLASLWNSFRPLHKVLSVLVVSLVLATFVFFSLPLWRPMGTLMLHKLWDVLRFLLLATGIGLVILNSGLWRGIDTEVNSVVSSSGKADSFTSKVPFAGVFYGEAQHSYSLSDKEAKASEYGLMKRTESESDVGPAGTADTATLTDKVQRDTRLSGEHDGRAATLRDAHDGNEASLRAKPYTQPANLAVSTRRGIAHYQRDGPLRHNSHRAKEGGAANEEVSVSPLIHMRHSAVNEVSRDKNRIVKPYDDLGLAAVAQQPKPNSRSKIVHRRGSSLEFTIGQEGSVSILDNCAVTNHQSAPLSSEKAASSTDVEVPVRITRKGTELSGSSPATHSQHSNKDAGIPGTASKHSRSQSAYNLNDLLVQQRPRSKPRTSSQLSKRRNVSLSCDLDKEHTNHGMPAWLSSLHSPPAPPLVHGYNIAENRVMSANAADSKQDESSLRKAFTESLAPWRAGIKTVPVNIPTYSHEELTQSNKDPLTKTMEKQVENTLTENTMGSPSPRELNKKVDAFIARFHERMQLQRLESLERYKQRGC